MLLNYGVWAPESFLILWILIWGYQLEEFDLSTGRLVGSQKIQLGISFNSCGILGGIGFRNSSIKHVQFYLKKKFILPGVSHTKRISHYENLISLSVFYFTENYLSHWAHFISPKASHQKHLILYVHCDAYWRRRDSSVKHVGKRGMNETRVGVGCRGLHRFLK